MTNRIIIGLSGKQYAGKSELAKLIIKESGDYQRVDLAKPLKETLARELASERNILLNSDNLKTILEEIEKDKGKYRARLIELGVNIKGYKGNDILVKMGIESSTDNIIIENVRTIEEYNYLTGIGAYLVRIDVSEDIRAKRGNIVSSNHITETALDNINSWFLRLVNDTDLSILEVMANGLLRLIYNDRKIKNKVL